MTLNPVASWVPSFKLASGCQLLWKLPGTRYGRYYVLRLLCLLLAAAAALAPLFCELLLASLEEPPLHF